MSRHPIDVHVTPEDRNQIKQLLRGGVQQIRVILRAIALEQLTLGHTAPTVARIVHLSPQAVRRIGHRYLEGGLDRALYERHGRGGAHELLDASAKQRIIAMVCSNPPEGHARWTVRLIAEEAVKRRLVPRVGRETIRVLLFSHELKPWRGKKCGAWAISMTTTFTGWRMSCESTEALQYNPAEPVICLDQKPIALDADVRPSRPAEAGKIARRDNEYKRCGRTNIFCVVEPKAGRHLTTATPNRSAVEFARAVERIVTAYPFARKIHLVLDKPEYPLQKIAHRPLWRGARSLPLEPLACPLHAEAR